MIPVAFRYERPASVDEALALVAEHGDDAKLLAGGHSLLPLMKLRLAAPAVIVDVGRLGELSYVRDAGDHLAIGALTTHRQLETDPLVGTDAPVLGAAAGQIGDPQVRHRGTIGGSLAHADPAGDLPAVALALDAIMVIAGPGGRRQVPAAEFFVGFLETALGPDEMLVEVQVGKTGGRGWSFQKLRRRAQDWAIVAVACVGADGDGKPARLGLVNMGSVPLRAHATEAALSGGASIPDAAAFADGEADPPTDIHGDARYRRHLVRVLTRRALNETLRTPSVLGTPSPPYGH